MTIDTNTRTYRLGEFAAVRQDAEGTQADRTYKPTLQISSTAGRTKCLSISWEEFERIAALLTGQDAGHIEPDAAWHLADNERTGDMQAVYAKDGTIVAEYVANRSHARLIAAAPDLLELARIVAAGNIEYAGITTNTGDSTK